MSHFDDENEKLQAKDLKQKEEEDEFGEIEGEDFSFVRHDGWKQRFCWFLTGICSLAAFNSLINTFDYYQYLFPDYQVETSLTFPITFAAIFGALSTHYVSQKFTLRFIIIFCLFFEVICMVSLPIIAYFLQNTAIGFAIIVVILLAVGFINEIFATRTSGYACHFHKYSPVALSAGLSISGVVYTLLRIVILSIYGDTDDNIKEYVTEIVVYSVVASFVSFLCIYVLVFTGRFPMMSHKMPEAIPGRESLSEWARIIKLTKWNLLGTFVCGCIFYTIYAGATVQVNLGSLSSSWSNEIFILISVISEVFGKWSGVVHLKGNFINQLLNFSKVIFVVFYYLRCNFVAFDSDVAGILLAIATAFTSTYFLTVYWIKQVETVKKQDAQLAGFLMVLFMDCGLALGNLFQIILF